MQILLGSWALSPIIVPLIVALLITPIYTFRYATIGLPGFLLLASIGIMRLQPASRGALLVVLLGGSTLSVARYATMPLKDDWRAATPVLLQKHHAREPLFFDTDIEAQSFLYYARRAARVPELMFGIVEPPYSGTLEHVRAVRWANGLRTSPAAEKVNVDVFRSPRVWVILCVPSGSITSYVAAFKAEGYDLTDLDSFQRIDVLQFDRVSNRLLKQ